MSQVLSSPSANIRVTVNPCYLNEAIELESLKHNLQERNPRTPSCSWLNQRTITPCTNVKQTTRCSPTRSLPRSPCLSSVRVLSASMLGFQGSNYQNNWGIWKHFISFTSSYNFVTNTIHFRLQLNAH